MTKPIIAAPALILLALVAACGDGDAPPDSAAIDSASPGSAVVGGPDSPAPPLNVPPDAVVREDVVYTPRDVAVFEETMEWAAAERLDSLEIGALMARIGRRFVGAPYTPKTLDPPGPERLIVNLREFDCVTFLESVLALARVIREDNRTFPAFAEELRRIRYRDGEMDGYTSRLHYFSEWIHDNHEIGLVRNITADLGGIPVDEPIDFMSTHADAYAQLDGNPELVEEIRQHERRLSARTRTWIPEDRIPGIADRVRDGDIIAATSSIEGLDIAHTGLALYVDGRLHLMHAPLVGKDVQISDEPLAVRIVGIEGQDGIMVARPL